MMIPKMVERTKRNIQKIIHKKSILTIATFA